MATAQTNAAANMPLRPGMSDALGQQCLPQTELGITIRPSASKCDVGVSLQPLSRMRPPETH